MFDLELLKTQKNKLNYSYDQIAELSNVPRRTVISIFTGHTKSPRIDTVEAIENVLGIERTDNVSQKDKNLSIKEQALVELFNKIPEDKQDFVLSIIQIALSDLK